MVQGDAPLGACRRAWDSGRARGVALARPALPCDSQRSCSRSGPRTGLASLPRQMPLFPNHYLVFPQKQLLAFDTCLFITSPYRFYLRPCLPFCDSFQSVSSLLNLLRWYWLIKWCRFQADSPAKHHRHVALGDCHPKSVSFHHHVSPAYPLLPLNFVGVLKRWEMAGGALGHFVITLI